MDHPIRSLLSFRPRDLRPSDPVAARLAVCVQFTPIAILTLMAGTGMMIDSMWAYPVFFITGFFLMAFWKDAISLREFRKLFFTLMILFVFVQAFDVFYWFTKTRNRGHFVAREFAATAQKFYREQTGRDIPLAFGDMWYAGCIMHYLPEHPYAGSYEDPYDEFRFSTILDQEGALGIYLQEKDAPQLADALGLDLDELKKNAKAFKFSYKAPYGKEKVRPVFFVVIPPRKAAHQTDRPQVQD